ncbi:TPA: cytoplasmic protein [Stenotrophomonas maltophilia]|jgi:hypothetical protein|uniref:cytoplasmic protein n=1 Tax=Burkholderia sp. LMG 13014 TaxID=2709306 RepID=UPI001966AF14|nr:cytoplasmic protein [Burkholderia sp. LMG 13014]HDS1367964.1 cytoplasmic protein [Stenotrophomonas maltophilia]HEJ3239985.1 cytoplasmic protein [Pseudomonas aeruginosa]HDS1372578.1 cytoplasmic protein [Stenotrophomonas maltophilia]HDS1376503.1 cytoplasmic protein [Stenotrophomonas maltophilia]HDS1381357.1 cytoplasmic protein [Stenotrophomonas maltophilia]
MKTYRLIIRNRDRLLGHFESSTPWSLEAIKETASRFPARDGYRLELLVSHGEKRLIESTPEGIRVLSSELLFEPAPLDN